MIQRRWEKKLSWCVFAVVVAVSHGRVDGAQSAATPKRLQTLVNDASAQFKLAYRQQPAEGQVRQEQLNAVVAAWRHAPKNDANNDLLARWLRVAIRSSMPGSHTALPAVPEFTGRSATPAGMPAAVPSHEPTPAIESKSPNGEKSAGDPFGDDAAP